jgi:RecA/RadA recombinase
MSHVICIAGESGTGKTTSMRKLDPKTTLYIDCDKKGLSWKGWKSQFNGESKNYLVTDFPQVALQALRKVNEQKNMSHIKVVVVDTINGLMVADEMRRSKEKGYDKWQDLAQSIYELIDYSLTMRDDVTIVFVAHTQTDHDENGYMFTRIKTSGRKLDKITLESKFSTVLLSKCVDGRYVFETQANLSTAKSPMGAFADREIDNDITAVIEALQEF